MGNAAKAAAWTVIALKAAKVGALAGVGLGTVGAIVWAFSTTPARTDAWLFIPTGAACGAAALAALPAAMIVWFLFLTMLGQAAEAVRGDGQRKD